MSSPPTPPKQFSDLLGPELNTLGQILALRTRKYTLEAAIAVASARYNLSPDDADLRTFASRCLADRDAGKMFPSVPPPTGALLKISTEIFFRDLTTHNAERPLHAILAHWAKRLDPDRLAQLVTDELNASGLTDKSGAPLRNRVKAGLVYQLLFRIGYPGTVDRMSDSFVPVRSSPPPGLAAVPLLPPLEIQRLAAVYLRSWPQEKGKRALLHMLTLVGRGLPKAAAIAKWSQFVLTELNRTNFPRADALGKLYDELAAKRDLQ